MRPSRDEYFMNLATVVATRSTCLRRRVGAVLVDDQGHVLSTGYNGSPRGFENCVDTVVCRRPISGSGDDLVTSCLAVHAEQNALMQCPDVERIKALYVTTSPCLMCVRMLMNTSCDNIYYVEEYPQPLARRLWVECMGRRLIKLGNFNWGTV